MNAPADTASWKRLTLTWTEKGRYGRAVEVTAHKKVSPRHALEIANLPAEIREKGGRAYYEALTNRGVPDHNPRDADGRITAAAYTVVDAETRQVIEQSFREDGYPTDPVRGAPAVRHYDMAGRMVAATCYPTWASYTQLHGDAIARFTRTGDFRTEKERAAGAPNPAVSAPPGLKR